MTSLFVSLICIILLFILLYVTREITPWWAKGLIGLSISVNTYIVAERLTFLFGTL